MVPRFDGYQIATILYSHAVLKVKSDELINKIQIHFLSSPKAFYLKPQELSMIIWSIARLKNESYQINLSLLLLICKRLIHTMSDINISSVLWGITVLKLYDNVLIDSICKISKTEMKSNVWALSRLMHIEQDLLSKSNILINRNSSYEDFISQLFSTFNHLSVLGIIPSNETIAQILELQTYRTKNINLIEYSNLVRNLAVQERLTELICQNTVDFIEKDVKHKNMDKSTLRQIQNSILSTQMMARKVSLDIELHADDSKIYVEKWMRENISRPSPIALSASRLLRSFVIKNDEYLTTYDGLIPIEISVKDFKKTSELNTSLDCENLDKKNKFKCDLERWSARKYTTRQMAFTFTGKYGYLRNYPWVVTGKLQTTLQLLRSREWEPCIVSKLEWEDIKSLSNKALYLSKILRVAGQSFSMQK
jgi:hypothetical protein